MVGVTASGPESCVRYDCEKKDALKDDQKDKFDRRVSPKKFYPINLHTVIKYTAKVFS